MTHDALAALELSIVGRLGISGTTIVCISETTIPTNARTQMMSPPPRVVSGLAVPSGFDFDVDREIAVLLEMVSKGEQCAALRPG